MILEEILLDQLDYESRKEAAARRSLLEALAGNRQEAAEAHERALSLDRPWEFAKGGSLSPDDLIKMYADKFPEELKNGD